MRDRQRYIDAGRNDPGDPQQMREHPYDFVSLPDRPARGDAVFHHRYPADRWSGTLSLVYRTETPLHVGSGFFESAADCGLSDRGPVRGILRSVDGPILPGSSWKGAIRSRFEAITRSRLALRPGTRKQRAEEVPDALYRGTARQTFKPGDPRLHALAPTSVPPRGRNLRSLSPADALFGCLGYRGRVLPGEGRIEGGQATRSLSVPPMESPRMHRIAQPDALHSAGRNEWRITAVEGRKFYYDGDLVSKRVLTSPTGGRREVLERVDHVAPGASIRLDVRLRSVSDAELGALLVASGHGDAVGVVRFGGFKAAGLGKVSLTSVRFDLRSGGPFSRSRREPVTVEAAVATAREALVDLVALDELHSVTTAWRAEP